MSPRLSGPSAIVDSFASTADLSSSRSVSFINPGTVFVTPLREQLVAKRSGPPQVALKFQSGRSVRVDLGDKKSSARRLTLGVGSYPSKSKRGVRVAIVVKARGRLLDTLVHAQF